MQQQHGCAFETKIFRKVKPAEEVKAALAAQG